MKGWIISGIIATILVLFASLMVVLCNTFPPVVEAVKALLCTSMIVFVLTRVIHDIFFSIERNK